MRIMRTNMAAISGATERSAELRRDLQAWTKATTDTASKVKKTIKPAIPMSTAISTTTLCPSPAHGKYVVKIGPAMM